MSTKFKNIVALFLVFVFIISSVGCSNEVDKPSDYNKNINLSVLDNTIVAKNNCLSLTWDAEKYCLILKSEITGDIWSTIPYDYYTKSEFEGRANVIMSAPLNITYYTKGVNQIKSSSGYTGVVKKGRIASESVENGIKVTYYFDTLEIAIPVYYVLHNDSLEVYIKPSEIQENENIVCDISLSPFLCSVANNKTNYLVVPSGSGALMYTDVRNEKSRTFSGEVYGPDLARQVYEKFENLETVRMPVFGAFQANKGIFGIVTSGVEAATINAESGNTESGFSNAYTSFTLRGYNISQVEYSGNIKVKNFWAFADKVTPAEKCGVTYFLLNGDNANYSGMANKYREYLTDTYKMKSDAKNTMLTIDIIGGVETKKFVLGIPYYGVTACTTLSQTKEIITQLCEFTNSIDVRLVGFGTSGISSGKVAGDFNISSELGNKKQLIELYEFCSDKGIGLYFDYELLRFNDSGSNFSISSDCVRTVNGYKAEQNVFSIALRDIDKERDGHFILNRNSVKNAVNKLLKKYFVDNISISTLGSVKYSDYTEYRYYNCNAMISDVINIGENIKATGKNLCFDQANDYAAAIADKITNAPTGSSDFDAFDVEIPLYQMVFKGSVSMSNTSVNMAEDTRGQFLKCVESGVGLSYTLTNNYKTDLAQTRYSHFINSLYVDNKTRIDENLKKYDELFLLISSSKIKEHKLINEDVRKTVFDNGIIVYVNYSDIDYNDGEITIPANGFVFSKGGRYK